MIHFKQDGLDVLKNELIFDLDEVLPRKREDSAKEYEPKGR